MAIARRDWLEFWRYPLNAISLVLQPLVWLTPVYFMGQAFSVDGKAAWICRLYRHKRLYVLHPPGGGA